MVKSKWFIVFLWVFYIALISLTIVGLFLNGLTNVKATIFYFVLLGLFCFPLLVNFIPSMESFNILGVEVKFKKELEKTKKDIKDVKELSIENIKDFIFRYVREENLTTEGKDKLNEWRKEIDEK
jgi:hypothetical protein